METEALRIGFNSLRNRREFQLSYESMLHHLLGFLIVVLPICFSFASSLVEEEHDVWYCLTSSVLVLQTFSLARHAVYGISSNNSPPKIDWQQRWDRLVDVLTNGMMIMVLHRLGMGFYGSKRRRWQEQLDLPILPQYLDDFYPLSLINSLSDVFHMKTLCSKILPLTMGLFSSAYLAHRLCQYTWSVKRNRSFNYTVVGFYLISSFRLLIGYCSGDSDTFFSEYPGGSLLMVLCLVAFCYSPCMAAIIYLSFLVSAEHTILIAIVFEMGLRAKSLFIERTYLFVMMQSAFFYNGTSNALQNIDVRAGYMGLTEYSPTLVGIQMLLNTYALQIVFIIAYSLYGFPSEDPVDNINKRQKRGNNRPLDNLLLNIIHFKLAITVAACWAFYWFSDHLFVWSVYAPKAFFECLHSLIAIIVAMFIIVCRSLWG